MVTKMKPSGMDAAELSLGAVGGHNLPPANPTPASKLAFLKAFTGSLVSKLPSYGRVVTVSSHTFMSTISSCQTHHQVTGKNHVTCLKPCAAVIARSVS